MINNGLSRELERKEERERDGLEQDSGIKNSELERGKNREGGRGRNA